MAVTQAQKQIEPEIDGRIDCDGARSGRACADGGRVRGAVGRTPLLAALGNLIEHRPRRVKLKAASSQRVGTVLLSVLRRLFINLTSELIRILGMQLVLVPAAYLLPKGVALVVARMLSLSLLILPSPGMVTYWQVRRAFGQDRLRSLQLAWGVLARPFQDFVTHKRVLYGLEDISTWKVIERNAEEVARLRASGQSFIIATAHFQRAAMLALACPSITPGHLVTVGHPLPTKIRSPFHVRLRIQYGALLKALSSVWCRSSELAFTGSGQSAAGLIYGRLRQPGNIVSIDVDAAWPKNSTGSYCRPFAGRQDRAFSTGAAQLAALTRCPIVGCVYWQQDDDTVILEWGPLINAVANETNAMNHLLDKLESGIGERPSQYVLEIGGERRWNEAGKRWDALAP
jgi:lauroyl/myristoyl acyltransferase